MAETVRTGRAETAFSLLHLPRYLISGVLVGALAVVFAISFAAIVYNGDLGHLLARGIGLTLIGAVVMGAVGAFLFSYRGTICQPQDVTAILLSIAAARIVADQADLGPDQLFATVATLVMLATLMTGICTFVFGKLKLSFIARFIPYPVLGGFLASTGYLLVMGAIGMTLGRSVTIWDVTVIVSADNLMYWVPWVLAGAATVVATRLLKEKFVLPLSIAAIGLCFFLVLYSMDIPLESARDMGLLLGPFPSSGFTKDMTPQLLTQVDWWAVLKETPILITVVAVAILCALLNAIGLEPTTGERIDLDKDLRGVGVTNVLSSLVGGLVGYHLLSGTLLARHMGLAGISAGLSAAGLCLLVYLFGANTLSMLPIGLFAAVIAFLGTDLLYTWLWKERHRLPLRDFAIVATMLLVAATIGFMEALAVGLIASSLLFIYSYSRIDFMRPLSNLKLRRSIVERCEQDADYLSQVGDRVAIFELRAFLFFGTANALLERIETAVVRAERSSEFIVIDFNHVQGLDASAIFAINKICEICTDRDVELILSGVNAALRAQLDAFSGLARDKRPQVLGKLDDALQSIEAQLLANRESEDIRAQDDDFLSALRRRYPNLELSTILETAEVADGERVIAQGQSSQEIYVLDQGALRAEVMDNRGNVMVVNRILPGAIVGEIAYYADTARTASVVAEGSAKLYKINPDKLENGLDLPPEFAADFHRMAAQHLAKRLMRATKLMHHNGF